jgi:hypothetical protein
MQDVKQTAPTEMSLAIASIVEAIIIERVRGTEMRYQEINKGLQMKILEFAKRLNQREATVKDGMFEKYVEHFGIEIRPQENNIPATIETK